MQLATFNEYTYLYTLFKISGISITFRGHDSVPALESRLLAFRVYMGQRVGRHVQKEGGSEVWWILLIQHISWAVDTGGVPAELWLNSKSP